MMSKITIGFIGVGHLAGFLIAGAARSDQYQFLLSPRNAEKSAELAEKFNCPIAKDNQAVVDGSDIIIIAVLPNQVNDMLSQLEFSTGKIVISTVAGFTYTELSPLVTPAIAACSMMPGLANAIGKGPSILYPKNKIALDFLQMLGPVHIMDSWQDFEIASVFGGFSGMSFSFMTDIINWFISQGLNPITARKLVAQTLIGNASALLNYPQDLNQLIDSIATKGGITELGVSNIKNSRDDWQKALDAIAVRVKE